MCFLPVSQLVSLLILFSMSDNDDVGAHILWEMFQQFASQRNAAPGTTLAPHVTGSTSASGAPSHPEPPILHRYQSPRVVRPGTNAGAQSSRDANPNQRDPAPVLSTPISANTPPYTQLSRPPGDFALNTSSANTARLMSAERTIPRPTSQPRRGSRRCSSVRGRGISAIAHRFPRLHRATVEDCIERSANGSASIRLTVKVYPGYVSSHKFSFLSLHRTYHYRIIGLRNVYCTNICVAPSRGACANSVYSTNFLCQRTSWSHSLSRM